MKEEGAKDSLDGAGTDVATTRRNNKPLRVIVVSLLAFCNCDLGAMYTIMQIHTVVGIQYVIMGGGFDRSEGLHE